MKHNIRFLLIVTMLLLVTGIGTAQEFVCTSRNRYEFSRLGVYA